MLVRVRTSITATSLALRSSSAASASSRIWSVVNCSFMGWVSIKLGGAKVIVHRIGHKITRAAAGGHQRADARGRNVELGNVAEQQAAAGAPPQRGNVVHLPRRSERRNIAFSRRDAASALHPEEVAQVDQFAPAPPAVEAA